MQNRVFERFAQVYAAVPAVKLSDGFEIGSVAAIDARDLWRKINKKQSFDSWMQSNIDRNVLMEGKDYIQNGCIIGKRRGRLKLNYQLSTDAVINKLIRI